MLIEYELFRQEVAVNLHRYVASLMVGAGVILGSVGIRPAGAAAPTTAPSYSITYVPPGADLPVTRVNGPVRGSAGGGPNIFVLSPEHTGLTTQDQPSLFWYLDRPAGNVKAMLTIVQAKKPEPLLEMQLDASRPGIQRVNLASTSCHLQAGAEYTWVIALVPDEAHRMNDVTRSADIRRIDPPEPLVDKLLTLGSTTDRAVVYARSGIWYDALAAVSDQIDATPGDPMVRGLRAALCNQASLPEVAAFDTRALSLK